MEEQKEHPTSIKWRKRIAIFLALCCVASLVLTPFLFLLGYINEAYLIVGIVSSFGGFLVSWVIYKMPTGRIGYEPNRARRMTGMSFVVLGAFGGLIVGFFGVGFLLMNLLGGKIPSGAIGNAFLIFAWIVAPIMGGLIGYLIFRRSKYSDPSLYHGF